MVLTRLEDCAVSAGVFNNRGVDVEDARPRVASEGSGSSIKTGDVEHAMAEMSRYSGSGPEVH